MEDVSVFDVGEKKRKIQGKPKQSSGDWKPNPHSVPGGILKHVKAKHVEAKWTKTN